MTLYQIVYHDGESVVYGAVVTECDCCGGCAAVSVVERGLDKGPEGCFVTIFFQDDAAWHPPPAWRERWLTPEEAKTLKELAEASRGGAVQ